jgi:hypothetical protein
MHKGKERMPTSNNKAATTASLDMLQGGVRTLPNCTLLLQ